MFRHRHVVDTRVLLLLLERRQQIATASNTVTTTVFTTALTTRTTHSVVVGRVEIQVVAGRASHETHWILWKLRRLVHVLTKFKDVLLRSHVQHDLLLLLLVKTTTHWTRSSAAGIATAVVLVVVVFQRMFVKGLVETEK